MPLTLPCSLCHTTQGHIPSEQKRPTRLRGDRWGIPGVLCRACYNACAVVPPCAACGTLGGSALASNRKPIRLQGTRWGFEGVLCKSCYEGLRCGRFQTPADVDPDDIDPTEAEILEFEQRAAEIRREHLEEMRRLNPPERGFVERPVYRVLRTR